MLKGEETEFGKKKKLLLQLLLRVQRHNCMKRFRHCQQEVEPVSSAATEMIINNGQWRIPAELRGEGWSSRNKVSGIVGKTTQKQKRNSWEYLTLWSYVRRPLATSDNTDPIVFLSLEFKLNKLGLKSPFTWLDYCWIFKRLIRLGWSIPLNMFFQERYMYKLSGHFHTWEWLSGHSWGTRLSSWIP